MQCTYADTMPTRLSDAEIADALASLPGWTRRGDAIERTFTFRDFVASMAFVNAVEAEAERTQNHPDIAILYSKVTLAFSTHDAGGITAKDVAGAGFANSQSVRGT